MAKRIGVVGAGSWGKNIVRTLYEMGVLAGVAELGESARQSVTETYPEVPVFSDVHELLNRDLHGVAIAAPAPVHHLVAKEALGNGLHTFIEKPMTLSSVDADDLVQLAEAQDCVLMVGHLLIFQPAITFIKHYLSEGRLGRVYSLHHERLNLGRARKVENVLWSLGVHDVAVCLHLAGEAPESVEYFGQSILTPGIDDDSMLHLRFPSGTVGHVHNSWLWPSMRRRLTVVGEKGMLVYDEPNQTVTFHDKGVRPDLTNRDEGSQVVFEGQGQPLRTEMEAFLDACATGARPISDGRSGLEVVKVLEQACPLA
ncbi:MAG: Gfo/Idh/MocA family oxidoreductase [Fimbriimonadaceae bacterium]|nr:Gfo/Idh/MocA family oxidoreductase [Fimbriimonadaceae bacterium]